MLTKLLFWGSILFIFIGLNAREGYLYFFFGLYLLISAIGLFFRAKESKGKKKEAVEALPATNAAASPSK